MESGASSLSTLILSALLFQRPFQANTIRRPLFSILYYLFTLLYSLFTIIYPLPLPSAFCKLYLAKKCVNPQFSSIFPQYLTKKAVILHAFLVARVQCACTKCMYKVGNSHSIGIQIKKIDNTMTHELAQEELIYIKTPNLLADAGKIIESAKKTAYRAVDYVLVRRNWFLGRRIAEELLGDQTREELYGQKIVSELAKQLTTEYGGGFDRSSLYKYIRFYQCFPNIVDTANPQSFLLDWSHYRVLLQVDDEVARNWYEKESAKEVWSVKTLQRNISSQYYYRLLQSPQPRHVEEEMHELTKSLQKKDEFVKSPFVAEFLGLSQNTDFTESTLEKAIITNLQKFLMELGKGYAFVARQQHICTEKEDYFIDLVFYNYILKCFVLIDLKTAKVTHQDVGQMDMYVRMYDELKKGSDDNPTIGIVLCADTDEDIARYSVLKGNEQLYASKYKLYLPSEDELRREIERQKEIYQLQHQ